MSESVQAVDLDPKVFSLSDYDNVRITMPAKPPISESEVDALLFEYALSSGSSAGAVADLDDAWVKANFDGLETIDDVREAIKADYDQHLEFEYSDIKFQACCEALFERLQGEVDEKMLENNVEVMRQANKRRLEEMHMSMEQFLREEQLTPDQYETKLHVETLRQMKLNVILDIMANVLGMQVGNHEITEYLSVPNPEAFLREIRENGQVENARRAAVRVKVMRRIVDTAIVEEDGAQRAMPDPEPEDNEPIPDFGNLPIPRIRDDNPHGLSIIE